MTYLLVCFWGVLEASVKLVNVGRISGFGEVGLGEGRFLE